MHFGITEKLTTDCVSLRNNAGIISEVSEKSQRKRRTLPFSTTPLSFDASSQGRFYGGPGGRDPQSKMWPPVPPPHFGPASLDFHLNRPVISLIQLHIVPPTPSCNCGAPMGPHLATAPGNTQCLQPLHCRGIKMKLMAKDDS